ncbi:MAG: helix-turn-helix domain-containing protein [Butyrivibrio sp.]|nr:helix-turn-helix domain-containing protein [Butyrivibrio sp.]
MSAIKEIRIEKKLTQQQVADLLGISLRSYKSYENDKEKIGTLKYNYILDKLQGINPIDEEHGILEMDFIVEKCKQVLDEYPVHYCILFGSYAKGKAGESSDVDLLISSDVKGLKFYGMVEKLRNALHKKVDVLNVEQLKDNFELTNEILKDGIRIYG